MVSFFDLWERMDSVDTPLMDSGENSKASQALRSGKNLRKEDERPFWDEFMELCSNSDGLADLLGVDSSQVIGWPSRIRELLQQIDDHDQSRGDADEEKQVLPTGDNGAITMPNNTDPYVGEL